MRLYNCSRDIIRPTETVSYTHLDVYKRQMLTLRRAYQVTAIAARWSAASTSNRYWTITIAILRTMIMTGSAPRIGPSLPRRLIVSAPKTAARRSAGIVMARLTMPHGSIVPKMCIRDRRGSRRVVRGSCRTPRIRAPSCAVAGRIARRRYAATGYPERKGHRD